jgi:cytochrome c oxidase assembly protein subunit 15
MPLASTDLEVRRRAIRLWLLAVAALVFAMVLVGGATRLTESGLSIVEWQPVTGTVPPLSEAAWQAEFEKYKAIPQYRVLNRGMTLDQFKTIYWWEWAHRLLAKATGAVFLIPLLWFLWRGWVEPSRRPWLWTIFAFGALQGAVGWWMVASGLRDRVDVSQYRLALHLTLACLLYVAILWTAQSFATRSAPMVPLRLRVSAVVLLALVLLQIYLGALVAGLNAGLTYNTWPLIDGHVVPPASELLSAKPLWRNLFENRLTVQFDHRMTAYALWLCAVLHAIDGARTLRGPALTIALGLAATVTLQAVLGIVTLLNVVPLALALAHQAMAIVVLTLATVHAERLAARGAEAPIGVAALPSP